MDELFSFIAINAVNTETASKGGDLVMMIYLFILATFLGFALITKVPPTLHTPLMSGSNAISGITILGALFIIKDPTWLSVVGSIALAFAACNVVGGYMVTHRMLEMFNKPKKKKEGQ